MAFNPCTMEAWGFPDGSDGNESACNVGDLGSLPESGRSTGKGNGNPLQYFWLENSMDRSYGPWVCKESDTTERLTHSRCGAPGLWAGFLAATEGDWDSHPTSRRELHLCHLLESHVEFFFLKKVRGSNILKNDIRTSLVVQWLRIHLPMQGTQVQFLVGELKSHTPCGN